MSRNKEEVVTRMMLTPSAELQVRETEEGTPERIISGYSILFNVPSVPLWADEEEEAREIISPSAITRELLDACDIKFTMFHDRQLILARSNKGAGTLSYRVDEKGVYFEFEVPNTMDGDKAVELVRRGDLAGCSFAFTTHYWDDAFVKRSVNVVDGVAHITYTVQTITSIRDFTLAADPYYQETSAAVREFTRELRELSRPTEPAKDMAKINEQLRDMRRAATTGIIV